MSIISPTRPAGTRPSPVAVVAGLLVVLLVVGAALALHAVQGRVAGLAVDDAFYLLMADRYFGRLANEPGLLALLDTRTYPPLYPLVLGLFGGGTGALANAYVANATLLLLWTGFAYAWLLRAGVRPLASALLALAAAFAPATLYHAQVLWSEHLYLLLQMLLLWQLERDPPRARNVLVAGLLVGLMLLTRTAGAVAQVAQRMRIPLAPELAAYKNTQMWLAMRPPEAAPYMAQSLDTTIGDLHRLRELTPAGACVYADSPGMVMVYAHRVPYQSPFTAVEQMVAKPEWPCRYVYVDPYAVDGLRDAARRERVGVRVLHASRLAPPDGPEEDGGMLLELPTR